MPLVLGKIRDAIHKGCVFWGGQKRIKTNKFLKIIRDASSVPNQYIPYTQKKCVQGDVRTLLKKITAK